MTFLLRFYVLYPAQGVLVEGCYFRPRLLETLLPRSFHLPEFSFRVPVLIFAVTQDAVSGVRFRLCVGGWVHFSGCMPVFFVPIFLCSFPGFLPSSEPGTATRLVPHSLPPTVLEWPPGLPPPPPRVAATDPPYHRISTTLSVRPLVSFAAPITLAFWVCLSLIPPLRRSSLCPRGRILLQLPPPHPRLPLSPSLPAEVFYFLFSGSPLSSPPPSDFGGTSSPPSWRSFGRREPDSSNRHYPPRKRTLFTGSLPFCLRAGPNGSSPPPAAFLFSLQGARRTETPD